MNEDIKNDLIEALLVTSTGLSRELNDKQYQREAELANRLKEYALRGYIVTGKSLFTDDQEKS